MQLKPSRTPLAGRGRFGNGLHDTHREPTDRAPDRLPFEGVPVGRTSGSRTSEHFCRRHICLSPQLVDRGSLVTEDPRKVSPLSRQGDVVLHRQVGRQLLLGRPLFVEDSPSIRSITDRRSLSPSSLPRCLISSPCGSPSLAGRQRGYFVHLLDHSGVRSCLSAGGASSATGDVATPAPGHVPFGPSLTASLARLFLRPLSALHLG